MPTPSVELRVVSLHMSTIRVLGDSAPGDMRTTRTDAEFIWQESLGAVPQLFKLAPPGVYSEVELDLGGERAIHATGYAVRGGNLLPFEIQSNGELSVNIAVNTLLAGREFATTKIEVDVASFIEDIDWDAVPITTDGRLFIGDGDSAMPGVLAKVPPAFKFVAD